jgi:hypothetical protein
MQPPEQRPRAEEQDEIAGRTVEPERSQTVASELAVELSSELPDEDRIPADGHRAKITGRKCGWRRSSPWIPAERSYIVLRRRRRHGAERALTENDILCGTSAAVSGGRPAERSHEDA